MKLLFPLSFVCLVVTCSSFAYADSKPLTLSLEEAILLAAAESPNVQTQQLSEVQQKFSLYVQQWMFKPHYSVTAAASTIVNQVGGVNQPTVNTRAISPTVSWLSPIGTQVSLASTNTFTPHYNPGLSLQIIQPLMRGFGRPIVEAALYNAIDSEKMSRLTLEGTLRVTITGVITAYLGVISAEYKVKIDQDSLKRAQTSVEQTHLLIKAGHKAGNELVTVQAEVANAETTLENDKNNLQQSRYALLTAIGLDPNVHVTFTSLDIPQLIRRYHIPTLVEAKSMAVTNNIQYQVDQITFTGATKRNLMVAEDNTRWQLNLTLNAGAGSGNWNGPNGGINSLVNGISTSNGATLNLQVPLDDQIAKQAVVSAKIALRQAMLQLKQERWSVETNAINGWNTIASAERALRFAEDAERLQEKTYHISYQKYIYGMIDSLELQTAQQQLNAAKQALVNARVNYLSALANVDLLIGTTLETWNVKVKYSNLSKVMHDEKD
jgi:outer membrane protein TolC